MNSKRDTLTVEEIYNRFNKCPVYKGIELIADALGIPHAGNDMTCNDAGDFEIYSERMNKIEELILKDYANVKLDVYTLDYIKYNFRLNGDYWFMLSEEKQDGKRNRNV